MPLAGFVTDCFGVSASSADTCACIDDPVIIAMVPFSARIKLLVRACLSQSAEPVKVVAEVSGLDASVSAIVCIAIGFALSVKDFVLSHVSSLKEDAGSCNLKLI